MSIRLFRRPAALICSLALLLALSPRRPRGGDSRCVRQKNLP
ncbi:MAG: hypothetical protein OSJ58_02985 [Dysosmobacter sp.]|nr:hypothetical protein [Dysosmobacter sp.]